MTLPNDLVVGYPITSGTFPSSLTIQPPPVSLDYESGKEIAVSLKKGDRLVIKRDGMILTSDAWELCYEFEVMETPRFECRRPGEVDTYYHLLVKVVK